MFISWRLAVLFSFGGLVQKNLSLINVVKRHFVLIAGFQHLLGKADCVELSAGTNTIFFSVKQLAFRQGPNYSMEELRARLVFWFHRLGLLHGLGSTAAAMQALSSQSVFLSSVAFEAMLWQCRTRSKAC